MQNCTTPSNKTTIFGIVNKINKTINLKECSTSITFSNMSNVYNSKKFFRLPINATLFARSTDDLFNSVFITGTAETWILGEPLINGQVPNTVIPTQPQEPVQNSKNNLSAILGGTIGGAGFISLIGALILLYKKYKTNTEVKPNEQTVVQHNIINDIINGITNDDRLNKEYFIKTNYIGVKRDELDVDKGDIILLLEIFDDGWCKIKDNDKVGIIPMECIDFDILIETPNQKQN